jgi:hypothetical protein
MFSIIAGLIDTNGGLTVGNFRVFDMSMSYTDNSFFMGSTLSNLEFINIRSPTYAAFTEVITDVRGIKMANLGNSQVGTSIPLDIAAQSGSTTSFAIRTGGGLIVFNEDGTDSDFRVEGLNDINLLFVDASTDRVGISTNAPTSTVDIDGSIALATVAKTGDYTATINDHKIFCDASGGAFTITLPAASGAPGREYHIKKIDSSGNAVTVDANDSETIDGALTQIINVQYDSMMISCDGTGWHIT